MALCINNIEHTDIINSLIKKNNKTGNTDQQFGYTKSYYKYDLIKKTDNLKNVIEIEINKQQLGDMCKIIKLDFILKDNFYQGNIEDFVSHCVADENYFYIKFGSFEYTVPLIYLLHDKLNITDIMPIYTANDMEITIGIRMDKDSMLYIKGVSIITETTWYENNLHKQIIQTPQYNLCRLMKGYECIVQADTLTIKKNLNVQNYFSGIYLCCDIKNVEEITIYVLFAI